MQPVIFKNFDLNQFWNDSEYALREYADAPPDNELINSIETELGYKLPASYIEFMKLHNGGVPHKSCFPVINTSWAPDHIAIEGFLSIGRTKRYSLCGEVGSRNIIDGWSYPDTGVYICDTPTGGHDMIMLDYSNCGPGGEPEVVHIDNEFDNKRTFLAKDFESFVRGLVGDEVFDHSEEELIQDIENIRKGSFSQELREYLDKSTEADFANILLNIFIRLSEELKKKTISEFSISDLSYDIHYYLATRHKKYYSKKQFINEFPSVMGGQFDSHAVKLHIDYHYNWFYKRVNDGTIVETGSDGFLLTNETILAMFEKIKLLNDHRI